MRFLFRFWLLVALSFVIGTSVWAELRRGEKLIPFVLKSIDNTEVTLKLEKDRLVVVKEWNEKDRKHVQKIYPDAVLVDFWAIWCPPCRLAVPHIQDLHERYFEKLIKKDERKKKEIKGGLVVIGVDLDRGGSRAIKPFAEKAKLTYLLLADPVKRDASERLITDARMAASAYKVRGIPTMYLFDSKGIIRAVHVGFAPGMESAIEEEIKKLVKSKPSGK